MRFLNSFHTLCVLAFSVFTISSAHSKEDSQTALESIAPSQEAVDVGIAGQNPADIARYLLANGALAAQLSPNAEKIALSWAITGKEQLWVMPATGGQAQQLTFGNGITFFEWAPGGQSILYGADNNGNEQESYFLISADGKTEKELMPAVEGGFRVFGGFSADGSQFAYSSTERNGLDFDIYTADSNTGKSKRVYEGKYGFFVAAVSPNGKQLLIQETVGEDSDNIYLLDTTTGKRQTVSAPSPRANHTGGGVLFSADSKSLYLASNVGREYSALIRYDIASKTFSTLYEENTNVGNVQLCGKNDQYLVWTTNHDGFHKLHAMERVTKKKMPIPTLSEGRYALSCSKQSAQVIVRVNGWNTPGDVVRWAINDGSSETVFESNYAGLNKTRLVRPESILMQARDGVQLQGLLYLPENTSSAKGKLPAVVFEVHGGPTGQALPSYNGPIQYLLGRGIAVFQPNVRGSAGFSRTYTTLDDQEKRRDSVRDLIDMLAFLKASGKVDADRAAVAGGSYGGYMVNAVLAEYPEAFEAGVSRYGVADWVTALEIASPALKASDIIEYGDIKEAKWQTFYKTNSPINLADQIRVPVLYSHGVMDPRIDIAETETMVRALRKNDIETMYIRIPDEGHGWRKRSNQLFYYRQQAEFLERYLLNSE